MPDHLNVLIVGAGPMAAAHAAVLRALGRPFVVLGRGEASAARFEAEHGVPVIRGGLAALPPDARERFAAAVVAVDIDELGAASTALARAGIPRLLIEKPAGLDASEIRALGAEVAARGCEAYVAYNRRFYASTRTAREMIAADGGVTSFHMEFTEIEVRILATPRPAKVLENFTLGNSSHVVDLAFHLGGWPVETRGTTAGRLAWHPSAAVFVGSGRTREGALFTWHADWGSAGRWSLDLRTRHRRLLMAPLEGLAVQQKGSFAIEPVTLDDAADRRFKPGLLAQMRAFLSDKPQATGLQSLGEHVAAVDGAFRAVFSTRDYGTEP